MAVKVMNGLYPPASQHLSGVWDFRDDPEGITFDEVDLAENANHIDRLLGARRPAREAALGYFVQPASTVADDAQ